MTNEEYLKLAAKFARHLLLGSKGIVPGSADACNLIELLNEGLGYHDDAPQVPLNEIVKCVKAILPTKEEERRMEYWLENGE